MVDCVHERTKYQTPDVSRRNLFKAATPNVIATLCVRCLSQLSHGDDDSEPEPDDSNSDDMENGFDEEKSEECDAENCKWVASLCNHNNAAIDVVGMGLCA